MDTQLDLQQLNQPQREAVLHRDGALLILAGAGSGKTRVITTRIVHLLNQVDGSAIVALTFTNKAAREMRERVIASAGRQRCKGLSICTFHALGARLLRQEIERLGYKNNFTIYSATDQLSMVRELLRNHHGKEAAAKAEQVLWAISAAKNDMVAPGDYAAVAGDELSHLCADVYPRYQRALKACNAVDFDDILLLAIRLLEDHESVRRRCQFRYVMVDEYQDTNRVQNHMLKLLSSEHGNLCVVGDDDQSIYSWRGADVDNIHTFTDRYPTARVIKLEQNYRSSGNILQLANAVIGAGPRRHAKRLWTAAGAGAPVEYHCCADGEEEAQKVVEMIQAQCFRRKLSYRDFAVLYRTNSQSRLFETQLRYAGVPYVLIGGQQFFDRKEVKDALAYLRVLANPQDEINLLRILNYPRRGIGAGSAERIIQTSLERDCGVWQVLEQAHDVAGLSSNVSEKVQAFMLLLKRYQRRLRNSAALVATVQELFEELKLEDELYRSADDPLKARRRVDNLHEVVNALADYAEREPLPTLSGFLEKISLLDRDEPQRGSKEEKLKQDAVVLMSLHSSKGLEFPWVFLVGMEEGLLPHGKSITGGGAIDEERRLCYVGITRARQRLLLFGAEKRKKYGKLYPQQPSRFIADIEAPLLVRANAAVPAASAEEQQQMAKDFFSGIRQLLK